DEVGREADEPIVAVVARRAGLAGERLADAGDDAAGAALHDALQDRHHLVGGKRILDLLAVVGQRRRRLPVPRNAVAFGTGARVGAEDRLAVAVLDAV